MPVMVGTSPLTAPAASSRSVFERSVTLLINGVSEWWLAFHGWTNDFMAAVTGDPDGDGVVTADEWDSDTVLTNVTHVYSGATSPAASFRLRANRL